MNALGYLIFTRLKNTLKSLIRQPARLIYVIIIVALIGFTISQAMWTRAKSSSTAISMN